MRPELRFFASALLLGMVTSCATGDVFGDYAFGDASTPTDGGTKDATALSDVNVPPNDATPAPDTSSGDDAAAGDDSSTGDDAGGDSAPPPDSGSLAKPAQGEVLISEVMFNPTTPEPDTEWFEVYNAASGPRLLSGLGLADGIGGTDTVGANVIVQPGAYVVFANKAAATPTVPAATIAYRYANLQLANSNAAANITVKDGATIIAQSPYGGFSSTIKASGSSIELSNLTFADESKSASWCKSTLTWSGSADKGTPGLPTKCQ